MQEKQNKVSPPADSSQAPSHTSNNTRFILTFLSAAIFMTALGYAMTVDKFTDYDPPNTLMINWHDYWSSALQNEPSANNKVTEWPRWSAQYPYRTILLGGSKKSGTSQGYQSHILMIYSKTSSTNKFTFEYIDFDRKTVDRSGYIRVKFPKDSYGNANSGENLVVLYSVGGDLYNGTINIGQPNNFPVYGYPYYIGDDVYFDFDFYYQCAEKHQQGASNLNISGLRNISNVPYGYILTCDNHGNPASSESGSTGGGGSSGSGGRRKWGSGSNGGGIDWGDDEPIVGDGGGYSSRNDLEFSAPSDWEKPYEGGTNPGLYPWEDDKNIPDIGITIPSPPFDDFGDGDKGSDGSKISMPIEFPMEQDPYKFTIPPSPFDGNVFPIPFPPDLYFEDTWPPKI